MTVGTVGTLGHPVPVRGDHVPDDEDHDQYDDGDGGHVPDVDDHDQHNDGDGDHVPGQ